MEIQGLLVLVIYLAIGGLILWGLNYFLAQSEVPQPVRVVLNVIVVVVFLIIALRKLGIV